MKSIELFLVFGRGAAEGLKYSVFEEIERIENAVKQSLVEYDNLEIVREDFCQKYGNNCKNTTENGLCKNFVNGYVCGCQPGFVKDFRSSYHLCKDINECTMKSHDCLRSQDCSNTEGSYKCIEKKISFNEKLVNFFFWIFSE
ncbi:unnamed protein product [Oikopleura dioica]|uniref:EGF-like calcium-binding domain-containing protein n=1 Tax=Oikopleura dioica TaxID=34765 RepID=E4XAH2_OIKDI|nr:unnamed protein product [Oikopleura dioica]